MIGKLTQAVHLLCTWLRMWEGERAGGERELSGGKAGRGAEKRRSREERTRGWVEGERCLERGSGVRDWKTEEWARELRSSGEMTLDLLF